MGMTTYDAALLLETIAGRDPDDPSSESIRIPELTMLALRAPEQLHYVEHASAASANLDGWKIGIPRAQLIDVPEQVQQAITWAGERLQTLGATMIDPAEMLLTDDDRKRLVDALNYRFLMEFPYSMDRYLKILSNSKIKTAQELADFNEVRHVYAGR